MSLLDQFSNVLKQYTSGSTQNAANGTEHFDQVAQAAPQSVIAEGLSAVFRSDQTPALPAIKLAGNLKHQFTVYHQRSPRRAPVGAIGTAWVIRRRSDQAQARERNVGAWVSKIHMVKEIVGAGTDC